MSNISRVDGYAIEFPIHGVTSCKNSFSVLKLCWRPYDSPFWENGVLGYNLFKIQIKLIAKEKNARITKYAL